MVNKFVQNVHFSDLTFFYEHPLVLESKRTIG